MADLNTSGAPPTEGVVDRDFLLDMADGDTEFVCELVEAFSDDIPKRISAIREALASDDVEVIAREAHALKGAVGNFSVTSAHEAMRKVEQISRAGSTDGLAEAWEDADREINAVRASLEAIVASF